MNRIRKVFSVNLQLILLFLGLGLFSVFSLVLIIWYNDRVEQSNEYINQLEKLSIWNEGIYEFYDTEELDRYKKPDQYRDFDHLLGDIKINLIGDIEQQIEGADTSLTKNERNDRLSAKKDILLYTYRLWYDVKKKIDKLYERNNYVVVDDQHYTKEEINIIDDDGFSTPKVVFREVHEKRRVLMEDSKSKLREINLILLNIHEQLEELLRLVRIENNTRISNYHFILWVVTILDTVIFLLAYMVIWRKVIKPLKTSESEGKEVYDKGFTTILNYSRNDEIGSLTLLINKLVSDIRKATNFTRTLRSNESSEVELETDYQTPLFDELIALRDNMREIELKEAERSWNISGQAIFSDLLTKYNNDFEKLVDVIIEKLVKYVKGLQGGLFLLNEGDNFLTLTSVYAYDRKKYVEKRIELGDGIVGQVWRERKTAYIENIPTGHVSIKSGLGEATPKSLLVIPLIDGDILYGVIEIASFHFFKQYEIEFVEKIGENIATTLASVRVNEQTQKLLKESQNLTEQMKSQEESMKQSLLDLQGAQEELKLRDIQRENELKYNTEKFSLEIEEYEKEVFKLKDTISTLQSELLSRPEVQQTASKVSDEQVAAFEEQFKAQIADLEETVKIKDMRIQKMRKKISRLQGEEES